STSVTFGAVSANAVAPLAHVVGMLDGSLTNVCQSGIGAAGPVQTSRALLPGKPVAPIASASRSLRRLLRNSPKPPRICGPPRYTRPYCDTLMLRPAPLL